MGTFLNCLLWPCFDGRDQKINLHISANFDSLVRFVLNNPKIFQYRFPLFFVECMYSAVSSKSSHCVSFSSQQPLINCLQVSIFWEGGELKICSNGWCDGGSVPIFLIFQKRGSTNMLVECPSHIQDLGGRAVDFSPPWDISV